MTYPQTGREKPQKKPVCSHIRCKRGFCLAALFAGTLRQRKRLIEKRLRPRRLRRGQALQPPAAVFRIVYFGISEEQPAAGMASFSQTRFSVAAFPPYAVSSKRCSRVMFLSHRPLR